MLAISEKHAVSAVCESAECEARRLQKEREREEALQQRLRQSADGGRQQEHVHLSSPALSPVHRHTAPVGCPTTSTATPQTPTNTRVRAPMLSQTAGTLYLSQTWTWAGSIHGLSWVGLSWVVKLQLCGFGWVAFSK